MSKKTCSTCTFLLPDNRVNREYYPNATFPICGRVSTPHTKSHVDPGKDFCEKHGGYLPPPTRRGG